MTTAIVTQQPVLRPFRPQDLAQIMSRDGSQIPHDAVLRQTCSGPAYTMIAEDRLLGCCGVVLPWPGVGMVWMVLSEDIEAYGVWLTRIVRRLLDDVVRHHRLHRVEAVALEDSERNQRWLSALGFTRERDGRAQRYMVDQRSVIRYERIGR